MTDNVLVERLAKTVMHWRVGPDRFTTSSRSWLPRWRFRPLERITDALLLLEHSGASRYSISFSRNVFVVEVECAGRIGKATDTSAARAITMALAHALKLVM